MRINCHYATLALPLTAHIQAHSVAQFRCARLINYQRQLRILPRLPSGPVHALLCTHARLARLLRMWCTCLSNPNLIKTALRRHYGIRTYGCPHRHRSWSRLGACSHPKHTWCPHAKIMFPSDFPNDVQRGLCTIEGFQLSLVDTMGSAGECTTCSLPYTLKKRTHCMCQLCTFA
jgi:hypothetical protein